MNDKTKWSYLAGLFDGEGSVFIATGYKDRPSTRLATGISNTNLDLMKWLISNFGGAYYVGKPPSANRKEQYVWRPKGKKNREIFFLGILPYLVVKREQILTALEYDRFVGENPEAREKLRQRMVNLNKKGSVTTNTQGTDDELVMIESELHSDMQSAPDVNQGIHTSLKKKFEQEYPQMDRFMREYKF